MDLNQLILRLLLEHDLAVELRHASVLARLLAELLVSGAPLLLAGVRGDAERVQVALLPARHEFVAQQQGVLRTRERDALAARENLVPAVLLVPRNVSASTGS